MRRDSALYTVLITGMVAIVILFNPSCATKKELVELRREMFEKNSNTESRLSSIDQSIATMDSLLREQYRMSQSIRALMGTQTQEQRDNIDLIAARQDDINYLLRELLQKLQAIQLYGGVETSSIKENAQTTQNSPSPPASTAIKPSTLPGENITVYSQELYDAALEDIRNQKYALAESRFLSFIMQFPQHELAGNAQYWLGEAVYGQDKYDLAINEFEKVIKKYPKSPKVPASMLKIGFAQFEQGEKKTAVETLNRLIKSYPKSEEAKMARERLKDP